MRRLMLCALGSIHRRRTLRPTLLHMTLDLPPIRRRHTQKSAHVLPPTPKILIQALPDLPLRTRPLMAPPTLWLHLR